MLVGIEQPLDGYRPTKPEENDADPSDHEHDNGRVTAGIGHRAKKAHHPQSDGNERGGSQHQQRNAPPRWITPKSPMAESLSLYAECPQLVT
jgi:hypothetical protein